MRPLGTRIPFASLLLLVVVAARGEDIASEDELGMTRPVVCSAVQGYGDYTEQPDAAIYRDNKLLIYYEPFGFTIEKRGAEFRALLTQDVRIRRRDQKTVLMKKNAILRYEPKSKTPPVRLYLSNFISTKGLSPGEYDLEIIMHDKLSKSSSVSKVIPFRIKPLRPDPNENSEESTEVDQPVIDESKTKRN